MNLYESLCYITEDEAKLEVIRVWLNNDAYWRTLFPIPIQSVSYWNIDVGIGIRLHLNEKQDVIFLEMIWSQVGRMYIISANCYYEMIACRSITTGNYKGRDPEFKNRFQAEVINPLIRSKRLESLL